MVPFSFAGETFVASPEGALYWPSQSALLVADLHLEKASWFARLGQFLPPYDSVATLAALTELVQATGVTRLYCLGGDLDGIPYDQSPPGMNSVAGYPLLFAELIRRGWSDKDLAKLAGGNILRVLRQAEAVAASMKDEPPSLATLPPAPAEATSGE